MPEVGKGYAAHPTRYSGVQFRSRLEAKWAAFFDLLNWKWEYEPIDLIGWVPDFQLKNLPEVPNAYGVQYIHVSNPFVEIKPFDDHRVVKNLFPGLDQKIYTALRRLPSGGNCGVLGLSPMAGGYELSIVDGIEHWDTIHFDSYIDNAETIWKEAGNLTQWKGL